MDSSIKVDRLSVMPANIIDSILTFLPILEAVRTSILSRSWRYHWHSLSKIKLNHDELQVSQTVSDNNIVEVIDRILSVHRGSIDKFKLNHYLETTCNDIDRWILYVSRNGIKELTINKWMGEYYNLPSCLFSCSGLTYLKLHRCIYKPPPAAFKAFSNLTKLYLFSVVIDDKELENLLNSCPLLSRLRLHGRLSRLRLRDGYRCPSLKINAPNLVMFDIREYYCFSQFKNSSLLTSATFGLGAPVDPIAENEYCRIVELLGSMPILHRLEFHNYALLHLAVGDVPTHVQLICPIKHLVVSINFDDLQELLGAFCIFRSSPLLQHLEVPVRLDKGTTRISADGFWKEEHDFSFRFDNLKTVMVTCFSGSESELKFIEFLLSNAPSLETMFIQFDRSAEDVLNTVRKLIRIPRISSKAEVILPPFRE